MFGKKWGGFPGEMAEVLRQLQRKTGCEDWAMMRSPMRRRDCTIYFLKSASYRLPGLVLKVYHKDAVGRNLARNLHRKSRRFRDAATPECTIPEPILFLPEENAMAMEYVDAPTAGALLMKEFHSSDKRQAVIRKAAMWLRWFHHQSGVADEPFVVAAFTEKLGKTLERIEALAPHALRNDRFLSECVDFARRIAAQLDGVEIPHAITHGDFTPFNLFIAGDTAIGFDYGFRHRRPVYHDICRFLVYLDVYRINHDYVGFSRIRPTSDEELRKFGCRREDFEVFMDAYGTRAGIIEEGLWLKLQFLEVTRRITAMKLPQTRLLNRLFRLVESAKLRRSARHMMNQLR
jgi:hypothetical protein